MTLLEDQIPPEQLALMKQIQGFLKRESGDVAEVPSAKRSDEVTQAIIRGIAFHHEGCRDTPLTRRDESDGRLAWLALAASALRIIRNEGAVRGS